MRNSKRTKNENVMNFELNEFMYFYLFFFVFCWARELMRHHRCLLYTPNRPTILFSQVRILYVDKHFFCQIFLILLHSLKEIFCSNDDDKDDKIQRAQISGLKKMSSWSFVIQQMMHFEHRNKQKRKRKKKRFHC